MAPTINHRWRINEAADAFLVALDISGFSNDVDPDQLLSHRMSFFQAVASTRFFPEARDRGTVRVHFLGDELRLAFLAAVGAREVKAFVDDVFAALDRMNRRVPEPQWTRIRGVVLGGVVSWRQWRGCDFLNGQLPIQAQSWTASPSLAPGEVAANSLFRLSLQTEGVPVDLPQRDFSGDPGYMLRS